VRRDAERLADIIDRPAPVMGIRDATTVVDGGCGVGGGLSQTSVLSMRSAILRRQSGATSGVSDDLIIGEDHMLTNTACR
jgi:hypothetical protein